MRADALEDGHGYISIVGTPPSSIEKSHLKSKPKIRWLKKDDESIEMSPESYCNPWALKIHRNHIKALARSSDYYLLLENLVHKHRNPCVIDLKVGTRQYSDDVSPSKKQRKIAKSKESTTAALGLRLCGLQSYNPISNNYCCLNKYYGRSLTPSTFEKTIEDFFLKSDCIFRRDVCLEIVKKCKELVAVLEGLDSFRFYTSSLLVSYDGYLDPKIINGKKNILNRVSDENVVDVRIIDFAHSTHKGLKDTVHYEGPDQGFIFGLNNFIDILERISISYSNS
nr:inositol hexakisphosphate kinase 1-like isoform X2 [Lepeophtheirus salmonis]